MNVPNIPPTIAISFNINNANIIPSHKSKPEDLAWIKGIGMVSASSIIQNAKELLNLEKGIQNVLNSIKENFAKSCPKCGGDMNERLIILGPERRLRANQCMLCKFYMPI